MKGDLPAFRSPPVSEVALAVLFEPLMGLRAIDVAVLRERLRERLPLVEEHPPLPAVSDIDVAGLQVEFGTGPTLPRWWFLSSDERHLVQVQRDRLVRNWRRRDEEEPYPHYAELRPDFVVDLEVFVDFLRDMGLAQELVGRWAEVTYVNPVPVAEELSWGAALAGLLEPWSGEHSDAFLPRPDAFDVSLRYPISERDSMSGALTVTARPARHAARDRVILLQLTARIGFAGAGLQAVPAALDVGHDWVVRGFTSITSRATHREWRRSDV